MGTYGKYRKEKIGSSVYQIRTEFSHCNINLRMVCLQPCMQVSSLKLLLGLKIVLFPISASFWKRVGRSEMFFFLW